MPQFSRRNTQPMRPESYRRIARLLREIADALDSAADGVEPQHKRALTMRLHSVANSSRAWWQRHQATTNGTLHIRN